MTSKTTVAVEVKPVEEAAKNVERLSVLIILKNFCLRNFLPIGIIFSVVIGIFLPQPAVFLSEKIPVVQICIIGLFFTIGVRLRLVEAKSAVKSYKEIAVGSLLILFLGPVIAATVLNTVPQFGTFIDDNHNWKNSSNFSSEEIPILGPEEFRLALQIYLMCPNAPAATLILVTQANGHRGLTILISVLCTILSVFTVPPMLAWLVPTLQNVHINVGKVLLNTVLRVLLPLLIGRGLRCVSPVKKVVKKWNNTIKYIGLSFLVGIFLVKVSETSASGHLGRVSAVSILCVVALGTCFTTFNLISSYGFISVLPWFSDKSTVTLSILSCLRVVGLPATIVDVLPESAGDKGLLILPMVFVYLATLLILNAFVSVAKVKDEDTDTKTTAQADAEKAIDIKDLRGQTNEVAVFTIYTDEISDTKL